MLIEFKIKNYKTFKTEADLLLTASVYDKSNPANKARVAGLDVLKTAVVYGANASGKTKFIDALAFMKESVKESFSRDALAPFGVEPFRLSTDSQTSPGHFEVSFSTENGLYRYGFIADKDKVIEEWLSRKATTKEVQLFSRQGDEVSLHKSLSVKKAFSSRLLRSNALLLSVLTGLNEDFSMEVSTWFHRLNVVSSVDDALILQTTMHYLRDPMKKKHLLDLLQFADLSIEDAYEESEGHSHYKLRNGMPAVKISKQVFDIEGQPAQSEVFSLDEEESSGTLKYFALAGIILDALDNGKVLVIDEMGAKLHPNLVQKLVELFHSTVSNPYHAQLIFNTHDTHLLSSSIFRRDQVWFVEKDIYGASQLYSLADFKLPDGTKPRPDLQFERNYLAGRFGGVPFLNDFSKLTDRDYLAKAREESI